jgi:hypothetical protein
VACRKPLFTATPDFEVEVPHTIIGVHGDWVAMEGTMHDTETATWRGKTSTGTYDIRVADIVELPDGKILRESTCCDNVSWLRQVGLLSEESE